MIITRCVKWTAARSHAAHDTGIKQKNISPSRLLPTFSCKFFEVRFQTEIFPSFLDNLALTLKQEGTDRLK